MEPTTLADGSRTYGLRMHGLRVDVPKGTAGGERDVGPGKGTRPCVKGHGRV
ncbi:hypothetical protein [Streptomyces beigongshangae]|uniref:hypothetical protein n=1 Tax=Streptomyces beigongshangae TaxID=2841597 RepID=UPI001C84C6AB|nr:hypothetical protein [Streptomyces sp. REN17]